VGPGGTVFTWFALTGVGAVGEFFGGLGFRGSRTAGPSGLGGIARGGGGGPMAGGGPTLGALGLAGPGVVRGGP